MSRKALLIVVTIISLLSSCSTPESEPALTPTPLPSSTPTLTATPSPSPTATLTPTATPLADLGIVVNTIEKEIDGAKIKTIEINGVKKSASTITKDELASLTDAIPAVWLAPQDSPAGYEVLIEPLPIYLDTCKYESIVVVTKAKVDIKVTITNLKDSEKIATKLFKGNLYPYCPLSITFPTDSLLALGLPNIVEFRHWIIETILANTKLPAPAMGVNDIAFSPDGKLLAVGSEDYHVKLWDIGAKKETSILKGHDSEVDRVVFSPDGSMLVSVSRRGQSAKLWKVSTGKALYEFPKTSYFNLTAAFSPDGKILAISDDSSRFPGTMFWDATRIGKGIGVVASSDAFTFSPDGKSYTVVSDRTLYVREMDTFANLLEYEAEPGFSIRAVSFSPNGDTLAVTSTKKWNTGIDIDAKIDLLSTETWQKAITIETKGMMDHTTFSPDGHILATQSAGTIDFWDASTGEKMRSFSGFDFTSIAFLPDGKMFAAGSRAGTITFWDVNTGESAFEVRNFFTP